MLATKKDVKALDSRCDMNWQVIGDHINDTNRHRERISGLEREVSFLSRNIESLRREWGIQEKQIKQISQERNRLEQEQHTARLRDNALRPEFV